MALGIREARRNLSELVKRAACGDEVIEIGARGEAQVALVNIDELRRLRRDSAQLRALEPTGGRASARRFGKLQARIEEGAFGAAAEPTTRARRRIVAARTESGVSRSEQSHLGVLDERAPRRRRVPLSKPGPTPTTQE